MRKLLILCILLFWVGISSSCQQNIESDRNVPYLRIVSTKSGVLKYTIENEDSLSYDHLVQIIGFENEENQSREEILLDGIPKLTGEILKIEVYGEIRNFEIQEIQYSYTEDNNMIEEINNRYDLLDELKNKDIILDTYLSDGIPNGKIIWENIDGKIFEYYLTQDGYGINGEIIFSQ